MAQRRLTILLITIFSLALLMGPGPGNLLINPEPGDPDARRFIFGMPIVYAWALLWFGVQAACVVVAYFLLWRETPKSESGEEAS